jgi:hypothetical protein
MEFLRLIAIVCLLSDLVVVQRAGCAFTRSKRRFSPVVLLDFSTKYFISQQVS